MGSRHLAQKCDLFLWQQGSGAERSGKKRENCTAAEAMGSGFSRDCKLALQTEMTSKTTAHRLLEIKA